LYGGTAIALRLGYRASVDFDFFSEVELDEQQKQKMLSEIAWLNNASILQNERNTEAQLRRRDLTRSIDGWVVFNASIARHVAAERGLRRRLTCAADAPSCERNEIR
jgi:hypothetical protein